MKYSARTLSSILPALLLAACGGGLGGSTNPVVNAQQALQETLPAGVRETAMRVSAVPEFKVLHTFGAPGDGNFPNSLMTSNEILYGTTEDAGNGGQLHGTVFTSTTLGVERVLYEFSGFGDVYPENGVTMYNGTLYGTSLNRVGVTPLPLNDSGTAFAVAPNGSESVVHRFGVGNDGHMPSSGFVLAHGLLYGVTGYGGDHSVNPTGYGTIYTMTPIGTTNVVHNFGGPNDGWYPDGNLLDVSGVLYGTTGAGGAYGRGVLFSLRPNGKYRILHNFGSGIDAWDATGSLIEHDGGLYGTSWQGGANGVGTVYRVDLNSGNETVLHSFGGPGDGVHPNRGLVFVKGAFYGTTLTGSGATANGMIFAVSPHGVESTAYGFSGFDNGAFPRGSLALIDNTLYGVADVGGPPGQHRGGVLFSLRP